MELSNLEQYFQEESKEIFEMFHWERIQKFHDFLKTKNEFGGFFSKNDSLHIWERHILESVYHVYKINKFTSVSRETKILDVGSGPGLPGYIFACLKCSPYVILLDSQKRKLKYTEEFLRTVRETSQVKVEYGRVEEQKFQCDLVVMRSVIPYPWSIEVVFHVVVKNGFFVPFLGRDFEDKRLELSKISKFGFELEKTLHLEKLKFLGMRHIKFLKKRTCVNHSFKRDWSKIQQEIRSYHGKNSIN